MKRNLKNIFILLFLLTTITIIQGQSIVVKNNDGTESKDLLENIEFLLFESSVFNVNYIGGASTSFQSDDLKSIYFSDVAATDVGTVEDNDEITLFVDNQLQVLSLNNLTQTKNQVYIYSTDGVLRISTIVNSGNENINISNLNSGLYIIRINDQILKFCKL